MYRQSQRLRWFQVALLGLCVCLSLTSANDDKAFKSGQDLIVKFRPESSTDQRLNAALKSQSDDAMISKNLSRIVSESVNATLQYRKKTSGNEYVFSLDVELAHRRICALLSISGIGCKVVTVKHENPFYLNSFLELQTDSPQQEGGATKDTVDEIREIIAAQLHLPVIVSRRSPTQMRAAVDAVAMIEDVLATLKKLPDVDYVQKDSRMFPISN